MINITCTACFKNVKICTSCLPKTAAGTSLAQCPECSNTLQIGLISKVAVMGVVTADQEPSNPSYTYSLNGEDDWKEDINEIIETLKENQDDTENKYIYIGEQEEPKPSEFLHDISEIITDNAYEECSEWRNKPFAITKKQKKELEKKIGEQIDELYKKNNIKAGYYIIKNVKEIKILDHPELKDIFKNKD